MDDLEKLNQYDESLYEWANYNLTVAIEENTTFAGGDEG